MHEFRDQLGRTIFLSSPPKRIISLVPSQTELLVDLGLRDKIVGVTKFCIHPNRLKKEKVIIGGTKNFHFDKIDALRPDLIIGNKEENYKEGIKKLSEKYPVWMSDIYTLDDALEMMQGIGRITETGEKAEELIQEIKISFDFQPMKKGSVIYIIWKNPLMAVGKQTFIDDILSRSGFINFIQELRYPEISMKKLKDLSPDFLFLSSEPFPFKQKHIDEYAAELPQTRVQLVDGEMFSWYGSRLRYFREYVAAHGYLGK